MFALYPDKFYDNYYSHVSCDEILVSNSYKKYAKFTCKLHGLRIKSKLMQIILATIACILSCWAHLRIIGDSKDLKILKR